MSKRDNKWLWWVGSLEISVASLVFLMILVFVCTLDQVNIGTFNAADKYFRSFFLFKTIPGTSWSIPIFPAGGLVGAVLVCSLIATMLSRVQYTRKKMGIWLIHAGMILLVFGEFVTGMFAVESMLTLEEGQSRNYSESQRVDELIIVDESNPGYDEVFSAVGSRLATGSVIRHERLPFKLHVRRYFPNAQVGRRPQDDSLPPSLADRGIGRDLVIQPLDPVSRDDRRNQPAAFIDVQVEGKTVGTWLIASGLGAPQGYVYKGRRYSFAIRPLRYYMPFTVTLKDFSHDRYAGTNIPKNFSSLLRLVHPARSEDRDVLVYMNHPLRYEGRTFFQASFGKDDTMSVLQVVVNPGWRLPYISCTIIGLGLIIQFLIHLISFTPPIRKEVTG